MAMHARPIPIDPYNPAGVEDTMRHPSPYLPIRIPVFSVVVWLNDTLVSIISLVGAFGGPRYGASHAASSHRRALSDSVESVEEGEGVPDDAASNAARSTRIRVSRGGRGADRRKAD
jgi:etoposide-induced 2.4 mRNA